MAYTDLDLARKRELLVNFKAALIAVSMLSRLSETEIDIWAKELFSSAFLTVDALSDSEVEQAIADIEIERSSSNKQNNESSFCISALEVKRNED